LRLICTLVDHSGTISLVWTTRGFYPLTAVSTLKIKNGVCNILHQLRCEAAAAAGSGSSGKPTATVVSGKL